MKLVRKQLIAGRKAWYGWCLLLLLGLQVHAQEVATVTGSVISEKGEFLPGITVQARKAGSATVIATAVTDTKGLFAIKQLITGVKYDFAFTSIAYEAYLYRAYQVKPDAQRNTLLVKMTEKNNQLDEVVVTGQGIGMSKRRIATNVTSIKGSELEGLPSGRLDQLLQAKLPNAQIRLTGGQAGATSIIRARGVTSAFVNSTPIIYVDGIRMDNLNTVAALGGGSAQGAAISSIADIPMDNIESIEYINGGAATTLYGSDAANGVIQIITKKGGGGKTAVTAEVQLGTERSTNDFLHFKRTADLLFQNGLFQKYHLAVNGGKDKSGFSFSMNYMNSTGVQIYDQNSNRKIDFSSGYHAALTDKITYENSFTYVNNKYKRNRNGNQGGYTGLWFAESGASAITGPKFTPNLDIISDSEFAKMQAYVNNAERLQDDQITVNRFTSSQVIKYTPIPKMTIKGTAGIDYRTMRDMMVQTNQYLSVTTGTNTTDKGNISNSERKYMGITLELNGQYTWNIHDFSFVSTVGGQFFRNEDQQVLYTGTNLRDGSRLVSDAAVRTSSDYYAEVVNYGVYALQNIGYKNRLFLDLGLRGDGNPAFGKNIGTQYYPKAGFSWVFSSEPWMASLSKVLSSARLRGSFGVAGNLPRVWANQRTIAFQGFGNEQASYFGQPGNDNLRPEKTQTAEGGIDLSFVKDRIKLSAGYYHSITRDALFFVPPAPSTGQTQNQQYNVGRILNKGWEFHTVLVPVQTKDITLTYNLSVNTLYNIVASAGGVAPFNLNGFSARTLQTVVQEGYSVGFLRGNYGTFDENGVLKSTVAQSYLGTTIPDLFGSMGLNFRYRNLSLFANADYQKGAVASDWDSQFRFNYGAGNEGIPQGEIDKNKRTNWLSFTNMFVKKTDFIKVRTIGVTWAVNKMPGMQGVKSMMLGFTVSNPFNLAASPFDPEATISGSAQGQGGATTGGISYATYSAPRQFVGSIRVNL